MTTLRLKEGKHHRTRNGHLWVFRDELDTAAIPADLPAGTAVRVETSYGYDMGVGFWHPQSQIAVRLLRYNAEPDTDFFISRLRDALRLRERLFADEPAYRLCFGESDLLPGLIIDRYGDYCAVQHLSAGADLRAGMISDALQAVLPGLRGIIAKNDSQLRTKEGLTRTEQILFGEIPDTLTIRENGVQLDVSLLHGQKTGYFLDQRLNRKTVADYAHGLRVLDCFTNQGGFALNAAHGGAAETTGVDISADAIERCRHNANLNGFGQCTFIVADVFDYLKEQAQGGAQWDMVILDPPAFTKSKAAIPQAKRGYAEINRQALKLIPPGGFLVSSSCSHHITEEMLMEVITHESRRINRRLKLVHRGMQSPCHPIYLHMPETAYLKFFVFEVW
ncbi:MAG: class I SAM-dependent rRNA methyltransferase [Candidatus Kapabacteria bacterium]|nr:class I SAM-dependent rRNA methyltransferase [Candidatus Kapabacteria bacterium]